MKFIAFIMAFLVLALSVMPCADNGNFMDEGKSKKGLTNSSHEQNNSEDDACSPFCTCTCCAGFSINHFIAVLTITSNYENNHTSTFLPSDVTGIASAIWQPPQLV